MALAADAIFTHLQSLVADAVHDYTAAGTTTRDAYCKVKPLAWHEPKKHSSVRGRSILTCPSGTACTRSS